MKERYRIKKRYNNQISLAAWITETNTGTHEQQSFGSLTLETELQNKHKAIAILEYQLLTPVFIVCKSADIDYTETYIKT